MPLVLFTRNGDPIDGAILLCEIATVARFRYNDKTTTTTVDCPSSRRRFGCFKKTDRPVEGRIIRQRSRPGKDNNSFPI
jgi:hypothetical protein